MVTGLRQLRVQAITHTLFRPTSLVAATRRLGFVQADPIRAPARAQDLILRHRVAGYRAGDLERRFPSLDLEEGILYAYGFLSRPVWQVAYPRSTSRLTRLEQEVLATVQGGGGPMHPRALEARFGRQRVVNAWGGWSKATTRALERLQRRGLLRVARRDSGIRIYEAAPSTPPVAAPDRFRKLTLVVAGILAPVTERGLLAIMARLRRTVPTFGDPRGLLGDLLAAGVLERQVVDGVAYLWPAIRRRPREAPPVVRFLAPFDPLVWERRRFEQLWGWSYRFEAYTPVQQRVRGYYALPLLWGEQIIGWANAAVAAGRLNVELGFVAGKRPRDRAFARELEAETARLATFLGVRDHPD
jgi:uncharacterized protein